MPTLTATARGQVTLRKDILQHLGIQPGQKVSVDKLPGGKIEVKAEEGKGSIDDIIGLLAGKTNKRLTIEQINEAAAEGWAGLRSKK
jgi:bifunctional DNA-binding transcriptional regulator/antitoxin component of YhaV-PrlF toxin-antitoxin module